MTSHEYAKALGASLRRVRQERGISLMQVEEKSGGVWKAAVVGSYERGDRHPTVVRAVQLCDWYGIDAADVLPRQLTPDQRGAHVARLAHSILALVEPETAPEVEP